MRVLIWVLCIAALGGMAAGAGEPLDSEGELARLKAVDGELERLGLQFHRRRTPPREQVELLDAFARRHPGTYHAAQAELRIVGLVWNLKKYGDALARAEAFCKRYPADLSSHTRILYYAARLVLNRKQTDELRGRACELLLASCHGVGGLLSFTRGWLQARDDLTPAARYGLALQAARRAGKESTGAAAFAWHFLSLHARDALDQDEVAAACQGYMDTFGQASLHFPDAHELLLSLKAAAQDAEAGRQLRTLRDARKQSTRAAEAVFSRVDGLLGEAKYDEAARALAELRNHPHAQVEKGWNRLREKAAQLPLEPQLKLIRAAVGTLRPGSPLNGWVALLDRNTGFLAPAHVDAALAAYDLYFTEKLRCRHVFVGKATLLRNRVRQAPPALRGRFSTMAARWAGILGVRDMQADFLFECGKALWDSDPATAHKALGDAVQLCPGTPGAVRARWFLERLNGTESLVRGPLPRPPSALRVHRPVRAKLPDAPPPGPEPIVETDGAFQLRRRDNATVALAPQRNDAAAADGNPESAWTPSALPAVLVLPLQAVSTVHTIRVHTTGNVHFTARLLDRAGRTLRRYERAWPSALLNSATYEPAAETTLHILPCHAVAFLKLTVLRRSGAAGGVRDIELAAPTYPAFAMRLLPDAPIPPAAKALTLAWEAEEPERNVAYRPNLECVRGFPLMRWSKPWHRPPRRLVLRQVTGNIGILFYGGARPALELSAAGGADWMLDMGTRGRIDKPAKEPKLQTFPLVETAADGAHALELTSRALPAGKDAYGPNDIAFEGLAVKGRARGFYVVRFQKAGQWGPWLRGRGIAVPDGAARYQAAAVLDSRGVLAQETASLGKLTVDFKGAGAEAHTQPFLPSLRPRILDDPRAAAAFLRSRRPAVVYAKVGTEAEHRAAAELARKAGCYLVSDDAGLNNNGYEGPFLAVGTPLHHRLCRQLVARRFAWHDERFLNSTEGFAGAELEACENSGTFAYVTGDTPEAVVAAARRVLALLEPFEAKAPFRLFAASTLERVYPWQQRAQAPPLKELRLQLGRGDRRSVKAGIVFDTRTPGLRVRCAQLRSDAGAVLPSPRIRFTGFHEWVPFFGDLRLPDLLVDAPRLPIPAHVAMSVWLTLVTPSDAAPGTYRSTVEVRAGGRTATVPLTIRVLPLVLPPIGRINSYSYSSVVHWFNHGTARHRAALESLYANEAEHGLSMVTLHRHPLTCTLEGGRPVFDFAALDHQADAAEAAYTSRGLPLPAFYHPYPNRELSDATSRLYATFDAARVKEATLAFSRQLAEHLRKQRRWARFYIKIADEPRDFDKWLEQARPFKDGGLQVTTAHSTRAGIEKLIGTIDAWCPNYQHDIFCKPLRQRQRGGHEPLWWYMCGVPPTRLTGRLVDNLPFYWLTPKWDYDGAHSYAGLTASGLAKVPFRYDHGMDFRMLLLPDGSIIDSVRRELESDGIRDCLLLYRVKDRIRELRKAGNEKRADALAARLDALLHSVVPYRYGYADKPQQWDAARARLYRLAMDASE